MYRCFALALGFLSLGGTGIYAAPSPVTAAAFHPGGKYVALGVHQQVIAVDAKTGDILNRLNALPGPVSSIAFSPDGKRLASASWDKTVKVWDAEKGQELLTLQGHAGLLRSVCFSPDGKRLASASKAQTVKVWSLDKEK